MANALALVLAGHGAVTEKNASALLDLNMPDEISPFTVSRIARTQKGLKTALAWFEGEGLEVERLEDPIAKLAEYQKRKGWDAHLVMVSNPGDEEDQALVNAAHEAGIPVKDLTGAYDDILPVPEETPAVDSEDTPAASSGDVAGQFFSRDEAGILRVFARLLLETAARNDGHPGADLARDAIARQDSDREDAPFDGGATVGSPTKKPGTTPLFVNEDGQYRSAEGRRKKTDEVKVWLTDDEIESLPRAVYDPEAA